MGLLDDLLDERRGGMLSEAFDENKVKRDLHGQFARKIGGLSKVGDSFTHEGVTVRKETHGFNVAGRQADVTPDTAAKIAVEKHAEKQKRAPLERGLAAGDARRQKADAEFDAMQARSKAKVASERSLENLPIADLEKRANGKGYKPSVKKEARAELDRRAATKGKPAKLGEKELPGAVGDGAWSKKLDEHVNALHSAKSAKVLDSEKLHRETLPDGTMGPYSAERTELHEHIIDLLTRHAGEHKGQARAVFLAGGPASGKSSLVNSGKVNIPADAVDVNPDIVRTMLPEYKHLIERGDEEASAKTHEEASHLSKMVMNVALERQHHVTVDGVGGGEEGKFARKIMAARDAGHTAEVHVVTIPTEEAVRRAEERAKKSGRHVPLGYMRAAHLEVSARFHGDLRKLPVALSVYDNHMGKKTDPKLIAAKSATQKRVQVLDRERYLAFLAKSREKGAKIDEAVAWWLQ